MLGLVELFPLTTMVQKPGTSQLCPGGLCDAVSGALGYSPGEGEGLAGIVHNFFQPVQNVAVENTYTLSRASVSLMRGYALKLLNTLFAACFVTLS